MLGLSGHELAAGRDYDRPGWNEIVKIKICLVAARGQAVKEVLFCLWCLWRKVLIIYLSHEFQTLSTRWNKWSQVNEINTQLYFFFFKTVFFFFFGTHDSMQGTDRSNKNNMLIYLLKNIFLRKTINRLYINSCMNAHTVMGRMT